MTSNSSENLDELTPHQLIDEVKQIALQYSREVNTARRTWPKSVKERVLALGRLGVARSRIGRECGIPVATIFSWYKDIPSGKRRAVPLVEQCEMASSARFLSLAGSDTCKSNPTVGMGVELESPQIHTVTGIGLQILLPGGIEVRGLSSIEQVVALYLGCRP